jgi:hypothetical protein
MKPIGEKNPIALESVSAMGTSVNLGSMRADRWRPVLGHRIEL